MNTQKFNKRIQKALALVGYPSIEMELIAAIDFSTRAKRK